MEIMRKPYQGVLNILSFNRHFYIYGLLAFTALLVSKYFFDWHEVLFYLVIGGFVYGLLMPLVVSAWVYDWSGYYRLDWLRRLGLADSVEKKNLNINAGFDQTSFLIKKILPQTHLQVYDFYDAVRHTEPAIVRARKVSQVYPDTLRISTDNIPQPTGSIDNIFLLSAIHEIRSHDERVAFLKECHRVCKQDSTVIIVEHLRDWANFAAFTIGFTHFFSKTTWLKAIMGAGFSIIHEEKFTPFMSIFIIKK